MKVIYILPLVLLSACGLMNIAEETRDKVAATNDKMDTTNSKLDGMREELKETNAGVKDAKVELLTTNDLLRDLKRSTTVNEAYKVFLEIEYFDPEQVAFDVGALATEFVENAPESKTVRLFYKFLSAALKTENLITGEPIPVGTRFVKFMSAGALAAYLPEEKFEKIIKDQVEGQGAYEAVVYAMAVLRFTYTRDWLIAQKMKPFMEVNMTNLKESAGLVNNMHYITQLPFQDKLTPITFEKLDLDPTKKAGEESDRVERVNPVNLRAKAIEVLGKFKATNPRLQNEEAQGILAKLKSLAE